MKFTSIKQTLIGFTVFLTILALGSCAEEITGPPPGGGPQPDYMSFVLTNSNGDTVDPTTSLSRGSTYGLVITPGSDATISTTDYVVTHTPVAAITTNVVRTNSVGFTVNNTADTSVTFTVTHKTDSSVSESVTLNLGPQVADYMSFTLTNSSGAIVDPTAQLSRGSTYGLVITPGSDATISTADYVVTYTPVAAITTNVVRTNSVDFTINNTADTTVTFTVTHRTASAVSETITLNLPNQIATSFQQDIENATIVPNFTTARSPLTREVLAPLGASAGATLEKRYVTESGAGSYNGSSWADAWAATNLRNGIDSISDATVNKVYFIMVAGGTYKPDYSTTVTTTERAISFGMKNHVAIMGGFSTADYWMGNWGRTGTTMFSGDIGTVGNTNDNSYNVFFHNGITLGNAHLYGVTITNGNANGTGTQNFGGGMHNRAYSSPVLTKVVFSGNTAINGGGMYNIISSSPVLTEVVFSGNTATGTLGGGGMYNNGASPVLTEVVFSGNNATTSGGGMLNSGGSSPVLTEVVFSGNNADGTFGGGGGMYNDGSSLVLTRVAFSNNSAQNGGGMLNVSGSSPALTRVVFSGNNATTSGGGMLNNSSSPVLIEVVFSGNTATTSGGGIANYNSSPAIIGAVFRNNRAVNGGGMLNDNGGQPGPLIVNSIFAGNTLSSAGSGTNIAMDLLNTGAENIRIAGSVLGIGLAQPTNAIVGYNGSAALNISYYSLANGPVRFGADATLTINGMNFPYPTITGGSAVNLGLFVRRNGGTYYFSETEAVTSWHTSFTSTGGLAGTPASLPTTGTTENLTATDIAGNARSGRPDAGVFELR